jgi:hypothetical protein
VTTIRGPRNPPPGRIHSEPGTGHRRGIARRTRLFRTTRHAALPTCLLFWDGKHSGKRATSIDKRLHVAVIGGYDGWPYSTCYAKPVVPPSPHPASAMRAYAIPIPPKRGQSMAWQAALSRHFRVKGRNGARPTSHHPLFPWVLARGLSCFLGTEEPDCSRRCLAKPRDLLAASPSSCQTHV